MQAWLLDRWQKVRRMPPGDRYYWLALLSVLALGVFLRLNGYLGHHISLWLDEALWAPRFVQWPLLKLGIRPLGFVWLTRALVNAFGATEIWFRFLPNLAALLSLALMPYTASRLLASKPLRVLLVLLFAIHPALVDFANEFKPYSFEVLVHLIPIVLYLRYQQTERRAYLYALLAYLPPGFLLAYNLAFAFPALLLLGLWHAYRAQKSRRLLLASLLSGALCTLVVGGMYKLALAHVTNEQRTENYWGKKYDVFFQPSSHDSRLDWTIGKYADMTALIGMRRELWSDPGKLPAKLAVELGALDRWLWLGLYGLGVGALWQKRRAELMLFCLPIGTMILANALGKWPFGAFRTNMFTSVYLFPIPIIGLELAQQRWKAAGRAFGLLTLATCVLPGFLFGFDWHGHKRTWTRDHYQREVIEKIYAIRKQQLAEHPDLPRARLVLDLHTYESHKYYLNTHPVFRARYHDFFEANFIQDNVGSNSLVSKVQQRLRAREPVWVVASKSISSEAIEDFAKTRVHVLFRERIKDEHLILLLDKD
jgi:Dolichyl-phosphate-mannose-protein mannosyltransferase